ncbi:MAG: hypothetical protein E7256_04910, partial [Lachnospiraceae bacterium]|nr:hypothetical protein [Lachnospiraceae bacterium]
TSKSGVTLKTAAGSSTTVKTASGATATLAKSTEVWVSKEQTVNNVKYFYVGLKINGATVRGYVKASELYLVGTYTYTSVTPTVTPVPTATPKPTGAPAITPKPTAAPTPGGSTVKYQIPATVNANELNIRENATTSGTKLGTLTKGTALIIIGEADTSGDTWYQVKTTLNGKEVTGYVFSNYVKLTLREAVQAVTDTAGVKLRATASTGASYVKNSSGTVVSIAKGTKVAITKEQTVNGVKWFYITATAGNETVKGYVLASELNFAAYSDSGSQTPTVTPTPIPTVTPTVKPTVTPIPTPTPSGGTSAADFETKLAAQGFPESYKVLLRKLHALYPNWEFEAYHTGLDWNTAVNNESVVGRNLITNAKSIEWKSLESGAYNWKTDSFIVYDGSVWVTASREANAYYMDPRNFLDEKGIFQFELLAYKPSYQNLEGVEHILQYTPLYKKSYTYTDDNGVEQTTTYAETFIRAAEYSGVSPYHLASRVKQEVVTGTTTLSNSVSGTVEGFEGLYNFYNIGAYHSTAPGGAIANGLKYAANGSTDPVLNANSMIPWSNRYRAIVGGAFIIGSSYINRGQNTIYLQKFNVTPVSTYYHQYMANIEAPYAEAKKVYAGYRDISTQPLVFSIPVYLNMPSEAVSPPVTAYNPNNWLKEILVTDSEGKVLVMTPEFDIGAEQEYTVTVDNSIELVNVTATSVSTKATVAGGGVIALQTGANTVSIKVTAQNGDVRTYKLNIIREELAVQ